MKNSILILIALFFTFCFNKIKAQNMVINPSFEVFDHSILPFGPQVPPVIDATKLAFLPSPWVQRNTCDFFVKGTQPSAIIAKTGIGNVGFAATASNGVPAIPYREIPIGLTNTLTAGQQYKIDFWVKRRDGNTSIQLGAYMSTSNLACVSACSFINLTPTIEGIYLGNNNQYTKIVGNWVAPTTAQYFIHIGNFRPTSVEGNQLNYFYLDDVSITPCSGTGSPSPVLTLINNVFCENDLIIADGSSSTNIDCYRWELFLQNGTLIKRGQWRTGTPTQLNINNFATLSKGNCYRLKLISREECAQQDAFIDFCIEDPNVQLSLTGANPYCEGASLNLTTTGDNGWTYTWSTGQSGVGLKNITTTTNLTTTQYSVTVTTSAGCTATQTVPVTVHPNNNIAPTINGINNTGDFIFYARAGAGSFSFNIPSFDAVNEEVDISFTPPLPNSSSAFQGNGLFHETGTFTWSNPTLADIGVHTFDVKVTDKNACNPLSTTYTITINILCDFCPLEIHYQDRHVNIKPLPPVTEAGRKIRAGLNVDNSQPNGTVETGSASILFEAPKIDLEPGFTGGANFTAQLNPTTCTSSCQDCCNNFYGFTHEAIPNIFTPNGDGQNDIWQLTDYQHPFCAYSAQGYELEIFNRWDDKIYESVINNTGCCQFQSKPYSGSPITSSIHWDGKADRTVLYSWWEKFFGGKKESHNGQTVVDGTYFYTLKLKGCGNSTDFASFITVLGSPNFRLAEDSTTTNAVLLINDTLKKNVTDTLTINLSPVPATEKINIIIKNKKNNSTYSLEILNAKGEKVYSETNINKTNFSINISHISKGIYYLRFYNQAFTHSKIFIKQ